MSDFPKPNGSFNPNAYRSQAAYDAHQKASLVANNAPEPGNASGPSSYRGQARVNNGFPKPDSTFNPNGYRRQARVNNHVHNMKPCNSTFNVNGYRTQARVANDGPKPSNATTFNPKCYHKQAAHGASNSTSHGRNDGSKKQFQKPHKRQATQKAGASSNKAENNDEPHFMTDAEVRQWFREAEADYERDKKAGKYNNYVPAGGHTPDFSAFRRTFDGSKTKVTGLKGSMHAPKPLGSEPAKPQGGN